MRNRLATPLRATALTLVAAFFALPIAYLVSVSFKTRDDILSGSFLPSRPTLDNWPGAFAATELTIFIVNSVGVAVAAGLITVAIALPATYATTRLGIAGKWLPQTVLASYVAPPVVAMIPLFFLLRAVGLLNTQAGLAIVYGLVNVPVAFWLLAPFFARVPQEVEQAAAIDGAGPLRILVSIIAPLIAPGIAATAIVVSILAYTEFLFASTFTFSNATRTLPVGISLFQGDRLVNFGQMAAASLAGIAPVYLVALYMQRHLVEGLAHGGGK